MLAQPPHVSPRITTGSQVVESSQQEIDCLPGHVRQRIKRTIAGLAFEPRPAHASELEDELAGFWCTGLDDYRIIYSINDEVVTVEIVQAAAQVLFIHDHPRS